MLGCSVRISRPSGATSTAAEQAKLQLTRAPLPLPTLLLVHRGDIKDALIGVQSAATIRKKAQWLIQKAEGRGLWARLFG